MTPGALLSAPGIPFKKLPQQAHARSSASASIDISLTIDVNASWDAEGDASNDIVVLDVAAMAGLGTGNPATVTGVGWDLIIDTLSAGSGASWLTEAVIAFNQDVAPGPNLIVLTPGLGDSFPGLAAYSSGGIIDFTDNALPDIFLPDGLLRIEFFEDFDDADDVEDAFYNAPSTLTIAVLDPSVGSCCQDATATCLAAITVQATCEGTSGQTWYPGEDCLTFACPSAPADYLMDGTPVTTCSGVFADSGDTDGDYANGESSVKAFTPDTAGTAMQFVFTAFEVETGFDSLAIYNGNSTAAPLLGTFDSANPPGTITSGAADGTLTFEFTSDDSVSLAGWEATISCVTPPTGGACCSASGCDTVADEAACGSNLYLGNGTDCGTSTCPADYLMDNTPVTTCSGLFTDSGDTGGDYANSESAVKTFTPDTAGLALEFAFTAFEVESGFDSLKIYNGNTTAAPLVGTFDTSNPPVTITSGAADGTLTFEFTSDSSVAKAGWEATISCVTPPTGGACCSSSGCDTVADEAACGSDLYLGNGTTCATASCPPLHDTCDDATKISVVPFNDTGVDVTAATDDANVDPSCDAGSCGTGPANNGVWYSYTPTVSCSATIDQTGMDAATSVWTGPDCNNLTQIDCSDPDPFDVSMAAGTEYWILVSKWSCLSEPTSAIDFSFDCVALPKGACCVQEAGSCACTEVPEVDCAGTYRGDDTSCGASPDPCDCNGNTVCDPDDLLPGTATVHDATGLPVAIPDFIAPGIDHVISVPGGGVISDLNVGLQITHTWTGDLCISLTHPSGVPTVQLVTRPGFEAPCDATECCGCGGDNYDILLDDGGTGGPIEDLCGSPTVPTSAPSYTPDEALSAFNGLDMAGDWKLQVNDNAGGDVGTLDAWALHFNAVPPASDDCNGNGTPDDCEADCDGNGVPDDCDVDPSDPDGDGLVADDCNGNASPDVCDVPPIGAGSDCQGDGIPDECQLTTPLGRGGSIVADGGFEAGASGGTWTEASSNFGTPLCDEATCGVGGGTGPHSGLWWCWFGGIAAAESGSVEQTVTIPGGADTLEFYLEVPAPSGNGTDFMSVLIDGVVLFTVLESDPAYATYALVSVDVSAYADGGSHLLRFESTITGVPIGTNFFVDDIAILEPTGPPANDCNGNSVPDECDAPICGNECLEGGAAGTAAEQCDGTLDEACPGECFPAGHASECLCPFCGDSVVGTGEDCDGGVCCTDSCAFESGTACRLSTGACDPAESCDGTGSECPDDVTITSCIDGDGCCAPGCNANNDDDCLAFCPNGVRDDGEQCDGTDDTACPGACRSDCTCPPASGSIPTVSQWGLILLTLLLLVGGRIYFGRRPVKAQGS